MDVHGKNVKNIYPLSPMQEGLLFHALADRNSAAYFQQIAYTVRGRLDWEVFTATWNELLRRHDILRTVFVHTNTDRPLQVVLRRRSIENTFKDLRGLEKPQQDALRDRFKQLDRERGFDLSRDMLMRVGGLQLEDELHEIVWSHHHILLDGWSLGTLQKEFALIYRDLRDQHPPRLRPVAPFSCYIKWLESRNTDASVRFWNDYLAGYEQAATIPLQALRSGRKGKAKRSFWLDGDLVARLTGFAAANNVTLATVVQTIWAVLLGRYNGLEDVVFGTVVSGRPPELAGIEDMVGLFVNTIPVRIRPRYNQHFRQLLQEIQQNAAACEPHHYVPLARIQAGSPLRHQLLGTHVTLENFPVDRTVLQAQRKDEADLQVEAVDIFEQTHYDFDMQFVPSSGSIKVQMAYNEELYDAETVARIESHCRALAEAVLARAAIPIGMIDILSPAERRIVLNLSGTAVGVETPPPTLVDRFRTHVAGSSSSVAATCDNERMTYAELNRRANQLARSLRSRGVAPDVPVAIYLDRSLDLLVAIIAVLKAGGAYVPIDLSYPADRVRFMLTDCQALVVLTEQSLVSQLPETTALVICLDEQPERLTEWSDEDLETTVLPDNLAYVIYTSGSTGRPKGVGVTHRNVGRLFQQTEPWFRFNERDVWTLFHSYSFDFSVWEMWGALLYGGRLVVVPYWVSRSADTFHKLLCDERVTVLNQTPSAFRQLDEADRASIAERQLSLRYIIFGGEPLDIHSLRPWFDRRGDTSPRLVNMYGITETTVHVTYRPLARESLAFRGSVIGRPIPDLQLYVLDHTLQPAPLGAAGEIYVGGSGVARAYLKRPALTAERLLPDPYSTMPGARLYRTGDAGRVLGEGEVEHLGRYDRQVKIRGFRIELGEIEAALKTHPAIRDAVVILRTGPVKDKQLAAYFTPEPNRDVHPAELREHLLKEIPGYMIPADYVLLNEFPLTVHGKLDRAALPVPDHARGGEDDSYAPPRNAIEETLVRVWGEVMRRDQIGIHDNYFALGGDSIKAIQTVSRLLRENLQVEIRNLFRYPTIAELTPHVAPAKPRHETGSAVGAVPLTPIQKRFFQQHLVRPSRFNHTVLLSCEKGFDAAAVQAAFAAIQQHHDALRARFSQSAGDWAQFIPDADGGLALETVDLRQAQDPRLELAHHADRLQDSIDLNTGPLMKLALYRGGGSDRLLIVTHHLVVDGVSWRILLDDFAQGYAQVQRGDAIRLPDKTDSFKAWAEAVRRYSESPSLRDEIAYWQSVGSECGPVVSGDYVATTNRYRDAAAVSFRLAHEETTLLVRTANRAYNTTTEDLLLTTLAQAINAHSGAARIPVLLEGHGREDIDAALDLSRTVGWFTSVYPFVLHYTSNRDLGYQIKSIKESIRRVPRKGVGYGVLRYLAPESGGVPLPPAPPPQISFNYLGQFDSDAWSTEFSASTDPVGWAVSPDAERPCEIDISATVLHDEFELRIEYNASRFTRTTIERLLDLYREKLLSVVDHCTGRETTEQTPYDLSYSELTLDELEGLFS